MKRLGREVRRKAVSRDDCLHHSAESQGVVGGGKRVGIAKVDLVLPRALLMVGTLRLNPHLAERQADLTSHILALVHGGNIHIACPVKGDLCGLSVLVGLE